MLLSFLRRVAPISLGLTLGCHPPRSPIPEPRRVPLAMDIRAILLNRGPCQDTSCPEYTYTFRRGSGAEYHGPPDASSGANAVADVSSEDFDRLVALVVESHFFDMPPQYNGLSMHSPHTTVTVWYAAESTSVTAAADAAAPVGLRRLQARLDSAGGSLAWRAPLSAR